ncbi:MAG: carbon-nitrogen hydrolase family protein [Planctomycetaceae bacterium]|nr:MAG: carbon-nitrogen hydrolase family protein [Planctomycetaceae bacterium]
MKIAGVQMDVALKDLERNLARIESGLRECARAGAALTVFPECAVSGYCFDSLSEALPFAQSIPGPATARITAVCRELGCHAIFGMLELDGARVFNAAVLSGPEGVVGSYRKVHLPYLGVDMFTTHGDRPFAVHSAGDLRVGMNICYDAAFPEASRSLALLGADLIALPTNWPPGAECTACSVINARALENAVYFIAVNRVGTERGFPFIGRSKIVDTSGNTLAESQTTEEEVLSADIDLALARRKHIIRVPGKHEIDRLADRRPEMYGLLTQPHTLKSPGRK